MIFIFKLLLDIFRNRMYNINSVNSKIKVISMIQMTENLLEIISDPISGPYEGEDFFVDEDGLIQVSENNVRIAAMIMRRANTSGKFESNLVKLGQRGDTILLGFDTLLDIDPVYTAQIGYQKGMLAEVKKDAKGKFCLYLDKKRSARMFAKLASVKTFIKRLDADLQSVGKTIATFEESDD